MRLILIRHGEAWHNRRGCIAEASCQGLTMTGREQVQRLANRLDRTREIDRVAALLSSPLKRARESADILASVFRVEGSETESDLGEIRVGAADGLTWEEYERRFGGFDLHVECDRPFAPGGQRWSEYTTQIRRFMSRCALTYGEDTVVAVTHAGFIVPSILSTFDIPRPGTGARLEVDFASLTEWHCMDGRWSLVRFNDTGHLRI